MYDRSFIIHVEALTLFRFQKALIKTFLLRYGAQILANILLALPNNFIQPNLNPETMSQVVYHSSRATILNSLSQELASASLNEYS
jgi:hypothetical protein